MSYKDKTEDGRGYCGAMKTSPPIDPKSQARAERLSRPREDRYRRSVRKVMDMRDNPRIAAVVGQDGIDALDDVLDYWEE